MIGGLNYSFNSLEAKLHRTDKDQTAGPDRRRVPKHEPGFFQLWLVQDDWRAQLLTQLISSKTQPNRQRPDNRSWPQKGTEHEPGWYDKRENKELSPANHSDFI